MFAKNDIQDKMLGVQQKMLERLEQTCELQQQILQFVSKIQCVEPGETPSPNAVLIDGTAALANVSPPLLSTPPSQKACSAKPGSG